MLRPAIVIAFLATCLVLPSVAVAESPNDILVVVNSAVKANSITIDELRDVFLKKRTSWGSSGKVTPVHASAGSKLRNEFRAVVTGMTSAEEKRYWSERKIKGGDSEPASFENTLKAVYKLRSAVSYIYRSEYKAGVGKVVLVLPAG